MQTKTITGQSSVASGLLNQGVAAMARNTHLRPEDVPVRRLG